MIAYKIQFSDGARGYQLMTLDRVTLRIGAEADGSPLSGDYVVTDAGPSPTIGVSLPSWASSFSDPAAPGPQVPQEVSPYQARVALLNAGMLDAVEALMSNPQTPKQASIAWGYATIIHRQSPFIEALAPALGLSESQIDNLFVVAGQVT